MNKNSQGMSGRSLAALVVAFVLSSPGRTPPFAAAEPSAASPADALPVVESFVGQFCLDCHNSEDATAELDLESVSTETLGHHAAIWERVVRRLRARQMPPSDMPRPDEQTYEAMLATIASTLDRAAAVDPQPGRAAALRRLTRTEYQNAIRDLLAVEIDAAALLPRDESSLGFDNVTVGDLSPTLLERYVAAAQKISRVAVGAARREPSGDTVRIRPDLTQEEHVEGLPLGTRGGALIPYTFPLDGEYEIQLRLCRDRNEHVEGLRESHELELLLDRRRLALFTVSPPSDREDHSLVDAHLRARFAAAAGPHEIGATFLKLPSSLLETKRQPFQSHFNMHRHPRTQPALFQVSITGPFAATGPGETPSRRRIFVCRPAAPEEEEECASRILAALMRRAYRRPVSAEDLQRPLEFFRQGRADGGDFDAGVERALSAVLVSPEFLFRIETQPPGVGAQTVYRISDLELASRLSFFVWSSIPDDELLDAAERGELHEPEVLERQVRRLLADARAISLIENFGGQWLYLRNLESTTPDLRLYPDFDDNLRQAFQKETELFLQSVLQENRSVLDLLRADYTFLNERLAKHYGVSHVYGSRFRRVSLDKDSQRGGLLRQGSMLTVTSYATRTSPVIRGKWILENVLGMPPPPPPANVPALADNTVAANLSVRERLAEHRANPACASCHDLIDPVGFSLENFDAVGRWRTREDGRPVDASGGLPDGSEFTGVAGLEEALLRRPELFVTTLTEKLLTFALGRGVEYYDAPAIRRIVRDAKDDDYRFSSLILGIVKSTPFQLRRSP